MTGAPEPEAVAYDDAVQAITGPFVAAYTYAQRTRLIVWRVVALVVAIAVIVTTNVYLDVRVNAADRALARQGETIYATCVARNESRAKLVQEFDHLTVSAGRSQTAEQVAANDAYTAAEFPQTACGRPPR